MAVLPRLINRLLPRWSPFEERGVTGTPVMGGYVYSTERNSKLIGQEKYRTFSDIMANVSIVATGVRHFLNIVARPDWSVVPADESEEAQKAADFVQSVLFEDLNTPWAHVVRRLGTYRFYGFAVHEWTAVKRDDGKIGYLDIEQRPQWTIIRWEVDQETGKVTGVYQRNPLNGMEVGIPRGKMVYLVDDTLTDSPEGMGLLRHVVEPADRLREYQLQEGWGFTRDLRGVPVGRAPLDELEQAVAEGKITVAQKNAATQKLLEFVSLERKTKDTAILLNSQPYQDRSDSGISNSGAPKWGVELVNGAAPGLADVGRAIERLNTEMARILGVEHLMLGSSSAGSFALAKEKASNLYLLANSVLRDIKLQAQRDLVWPLWRLNGLPDRLMPELSTEDVSPRDVAQAAAVLRDLATAGAPIQPNDEEIQNWIRDMLGAPQVDLEELRAAYDGALNGQGGDPYNMAEQIKALTGPAGNGALQGAGEGPAGNPFSKMRKRSSALGFWDESRVNRHPAGTPGSKGGEFAPKGEGAEGGAGLIGNQGHPATVSTANITAVRVPEEEKRKYRRVGLDTMRQDPAKFAEAIAKLDGPAYLNLRPDEAKGDPDVVAERFISHASDNLVALYERAPAELRQHSGKWYEGARLRVDQLVDKYKQQGLDVPAATAAIAALSPTKDWYQNLSLAERTIDIVLTKADKPWTKDMDRLMRTAAWVPQDTRKAIRGKSYKDLTDVAHKAAWVRLYDQTNNSPSHHVILPDGRNDGIARNKADTSDIKLAWQSLASVSNAIAAIESRGDQKVISESLGGAHKVRSFYNNIIDPNSPNHDVTIDTHAVGAALLRQTSNTDTVVNHAFGNTPMIQGRPADWQGAVGGSAITGTRGTYGLYAEAYRRAASKLGILPRELQSITWEMKRAMAPDSKKAPEAVEQIWREYHAGKRTLEETRKAVFEAAPYVEPPWLKWMRDNA